MSGAVSTQVSQTSELTSAHPAEVLVRARGAMFIATTERGNIAPPGARELGLFERDVRFLSHYELAIRGGEVAYLSAEASGDTFNQIDLMLSGGERPAFLDDPQNYVHIRRRQLLDGAFVDELTFTNYLGRELALEVVLAFAADFVDIFEVRGAHRPMRGVAREPRVVEDEVDLRYEGLDGVSYATSVSFDPVPSRVTASSATFSFTLASRQTRVIQITVHATRDMRRPEAMPLFEDRRTRLDAEAREFRGRCARFRCDDPKLDQCLSRSASDLFALRTRVSEQAIVSAGIPWFCCPFGRDALIASYEALLLDPEIAASSLRALAAWQGKRYDPFTEEEPGKILHELRFGEMAGAGEIPHTPYYGTMDATPLFVIVAHAVYETTADASLVRELAPAIRGALGWLDEQTHAGSRLVTYERRSAHGLENQSWKDSRDAVVFPDGSRAVPPIAICEVQGYAVDAYRRGAQLLAVIGDAERARSFRELVDERLWLKEQGRYAYALAGDGKAVDTVVSNLGHLLWSRVPEDGPRARATRELLLRPESFSGYGIRTLAADQRAFNPLSYHNGTVWPHDNALIARGLSFYGYRKEAAQVLAGLVAALDGFRDRRWPELFCGMDRESGLLVRYPVACSPQAWAAAAPYLLVQSMLGIAVDAPAGRLRVVGPVMPPSVRELTIERLRVGSARVSLRFRREDQRCHVDLVDVVGGPVKTEIELS